jgi:hypothetical protein
MVVCMAMEYIDGQMQEYIMDNIQIILNMVTDIKKTPMDWNFLENGLMATTWVSNLEWPIIFIQINEEKSQSVKLNIILYFSMAYISKLKILIIIC